MPKIIYKHFNLRNLTLNIIDDANEIIADYLAQGFDLTLRQLYYQFVSRNLFPETWIDPKTGSKNSQRSYDKLGVIINNARLAGLIDWDAISDRTRYVRSLSHWSSPASIIRSAEDSYRLDKWQNQEYHPEIWIEKDALVGVIQDICEELDVPYFSCRGYVSQSEMWLAGQRFLEHIKMGQKPYLIHLGDHDPSGIDMTNDNIRRLEMFTESTCDYKFEVKRIALNYDQVQHYNPPPNFAKSTDSRSGSYIDQFGTDCWELDALEPSVIVDLIQGEIFSIRDPDALEEIEDQEQQEKKELTKIRTRYYDVIEYLNEKED